MRYNSYTTATRTTALALLGTAPDACVAEQMGIPVSTIYYWRVQRHIPAYRLSHTTERYAALLRAHPAGLTARQIQDGLGVTRQAVYPILKSLEQRGVITHRTVFSHQRYGGRAYTLLWQIAQEDTHAPTQCD